MSRLVIWFRKKIRRYEDGAQWLKVVGTIGMFTWRDSGCCRTFSLLLLLLCLVGREGAARL